MFEPVHLTRVPTGIDPASVEYTVIDVETTGLLPGRGQRVCEIAAIRMRYDGTVLEEMSSLVNPQRRIPAENERMHGISNHMVAAAPVFGQIAGTLLRMMSGAVVVAHNLPFEDQFLTMEFERVGVRGLHAPGLCTLSATRSHLDLHDYQLASVAHGLSGSWPATRHGALADCRTAARILSALICVSPQRLHLTPATIRASLPTLPEAERLLPRLVPVRSGPYIWVENLAQFLPRRATMPRPAAESAWRAAAVRALSHGRLEQADAEQLAAHASVAGYVPDTLPQTLLGLWQDRLDQESVPVSPAAARDLHHLAAVLGLSQAAAARLPKVSSELKGWRIVPLGTGPETAEVAAWAALHGATIGKRPSKTTRLLIADPDTVLGTAQVNGAGQLPVMTPQAAQAHLRTLVAQAQAAGAPAHQPGEGPATGLTIKAPALQSVWRPVELPGVLTLGKFTWPVRWLVEQALDPNVRTITLQQGPQPRLHVKRAALSADERERLDEAYPIIQAKLRAARPLPAPRKPLPAQHRETGPGSLSKLVARLRAAFR